MNSSITPIEPCERMISVDSHVLFTDEWITRHLPERLKQKWLDGSRQFQQEEADKRGDWVPDINDIMDPEAWNDPGHYEPHAKLKAMDRDNVFAEVIFPEVGAAKVCAPRLMGDDWKEMVSGFNDSMADFASADASRLMCAYQILPFDIDASIKEVERAARRGARCVQLPAFPTEMGLLDYFNGYYDRLWGAVQEMGLTVLNHLDTTQKSMELLKRDPTKQRAVALAMPPLQLAETISLWIMGGTMEKFPKLKVLFVEPGLGWLPFLFDTLLDGRIRQGHYTFPNLKMLPSEYFKRQMGATFMYEPLGLKYACEYFGPDCLYWSTDFPHPATSWPNSRALAEKQFSAAGVNATDRRKMTFGNAARTFGTG
jgi:predicted TIM-barrel fold metal-dependent hydrolase